MLSRQSATTGMPATQPAFGSALRLNSRLGLILAIVVCGLLHVLTPEQRLTPAVLQLAATIEGSFKPDGHYAGEPLLGVDNGLRLWGSWSGSDDNVGQLTLGPFAAPRNFRLAVSGYPDRPGNELYLEQKSSGERFPLPRAAVGERWETFHLKLPAEWVGKEITLVARDNSTGHGGWLAISEPLEGGRGDGRNGLQESFAAWAINGLLLWLLWSAAVEWLARRAWFEPQWLPLVAGAAVAAAGYVAFWIFFAHATAGKIFVLLLLAGAFRRAWHRPPEAALPDEAMAAGRLMLAVGAFHLALLHLYPSSRDFDSLASSRYRENLPGDNTLSFNLASILYRGESPKTPIGGWQSSDRPPLQSGWQLLTWPVTATLRLHDRTAAGTSAVWFQLLWVPAGLGLLRTLGLAPRRALAWTALCSLSGFFIQNTVFTWPKLSAGAFVCGSFGLWVLTRRSPDAPGRAGEVGVGAALAALAWLSHGSATFSLLAMAPWLIWRAIRGEGRTWCFAAGAFLLIAAPWLCYQKFYDPPGTRLLKWHLAGQDALTAQGVWADIRAAYAPLSTSEILARKLANLGYQVKGEWASLFRFDLAGAPSRRADEFFHTGRALTWWLAGLAAWPWLLWRARRTSALPLGRNHAILAGWMLLTISVWCAVMWQHAVLHHGSYAVPMGLLALLSAMLEVASPWSLALIATLQAATFATTYVVPNALVHGPPLGWPILLLSAVGVFAVASDRPCLGAPENWINAARIQGKTFFAAFRQWWAQPRVTWGAVLVLGILLACRHPSALHTPQLWAEDGAIFLTYNDLNGLGAFAMPYAGYLHTIPRLIAWTASHLLDVRWWPAFYNWAAFALWLAVTARMLSPRLRLPGKPWLALACFLGPQTGEVLFNITNVQWITGLAFVQLALLARPASRRERIGDLAWLALIALTGPFVIIFLPLFAWRWWRDRHLDNLALLLVGLSCAGIQGWFLLHAGPHPEPRPDHFSLAPLLVVLGRRLVAWPALGDRLAVELPGALIGVVGTVFLVALLVRAFRRDALRPMRTMIAAAFLLILVASVLRTRPDGWGSDYVYYLFYGDRYFYIPRVLLAWLLILEFESSSRFFARAAKLLCLLMAVAHLKPYAVPAPPNYDWASRCDPIRRGVKATIPTLPVGWEFDYLGRPPRP